MNRAIYDEIGAGYVHGRCADQRLANALLNLLAVPPGSILAEIGAGTGNYSRAVADAGMNIVAVEPSIVMRGQAEEHSNVEFREGVAESIPLPDNSVAGVFSILAFHHFMEPKKALREMRRVCPNGPIVLFTFDPRKIEKPWFADYFPKVWADCFDFFPPIEQVKAAIHSLTNGPVDSIPFELPSDMEDLFAGAVWNRPELYLDERIRSGISSFTLANPIDIRDGVARLNADLKSGLWDKKHGWLRNEKTLDVGYRFVWALPHGDKNA